MEPTRQDTDSWYNLMSYDKHHKAWMLTRSKISSIDYARKLLRSYRKDVPKGYFKLKQVIRWKQYYETMLKD